MGATVPASAEVATESGESLHVHVRNGQAMATEKDVTIHMEWNRGLDPLNLQEGTYDSPVIAAENTRAHLSAA